MWFETPWQTTGMSSSKSAMFRLYNQIGMRKRSGLPPRSQCQSTVLGAMVQSSAGLDVEGCLEVSQSLTNDDYQYVGGLLKVQLFCIKYIILKQYAKQNGAVHPASHSSSKANTLVTATQTASRRSIATGRS